MVILLLALVRSLVIYRPSIMELDLESKQFKFVLGLLLTTIIYDVTCYTTGKFFMENSSQVRLVLYHPQTVFNLDKILFSNFE